VFPFARSGFILFLLSRSHAFDRFMHGEIDRAGPVWACPALNLVRAERFAFGARPWED
jgi:hypothetical protein